MYTIKDLCEKSKLSRSTILYYHSIGLLTPTSRSDDNYRIYSDDALKTLKSICTYREAGVSLGAIAEILSLGENIEREILERTLFKLNMEAQKIKEKQELIVKMIEGGKNIMEAIKGINGNLIKESLKLIGVDDDGMDKLHAHLEKTSPEGHQSFLEMLGLSEEEIKYVRDNAKEYYKDRKID